MSLIGRTAVFRGFAIGKQSVDKDMPDFHGRSEFREADYYAARG
jgi:hypothetical protein